MRRAKGWGRDKLVAVNEVSLEIRQGETLGLVGRVQDAASRPLAA